jgi:hypothetical protein
VQPEKPAPGLATPDLVMSRAEVEPRGGAGIDSTSTRRGMGARHTGARTGHDTTRRTGRGGGWTTARRQTWRGSMRDGGNTARQLGAGGPQ